MSNTRRGIAFETLRLRKGGHASPSKGLCVMEAVAYFRGLKHTDRPPCVSEAIGAFLRSWNDALYVVCGVMVLASGLWFWGAAYLKRDTERVERAEA